MLRTLTREWKRVRTSIGNLVYVTHVNPHTLVNVYRDGSRWLYLVIGWPEGEFSQRPIILEHGDAATKNEACYYAELKLGNASNQQEPLPW